jgi:flavin-dependent dehydrogenase
MFDVIVVGGGPGGSAAAKKCAQHGFKTLLIEKKRLPRDKVCSGMVMGPWAQETIQKEFGEIPQEILAAPYYLSGHVIHVPEVEPQIIECRTPLAWRRDLDFWMNQRARDAGVEIWERAKVMGVAQNGGGCTVTLKKAGQEQSLRARFVIGADGAASAVRKSLFPQLKVRYSTPIRECYKGSLDIEKDYFHWFFPHTRPRPRFALNHKGDFFLIEGSGIRELRAEIQQILAPYGFDLGSKPLWKDGCVEPRLHNELISGSFSPAEGNTLLIGDAAGLVFPITFEGIGSALKSGLVAAKSINEAHRLGQDAAGIYLQRLAPILEVLKALFSLDEGLEKATPKGAAHFSRTLKAAYKETFKGS